MRFKILTMTEAAKTKRIEGPECSIVDLKMTFFLNEKQSRNIVNMFTICWCQTRCRFLSRCYTSGALDCHVNKKITFKCAISRCTIRWFYVRTCFFFALPPLTKNKMWKQSSIKCCSTPADSMFRLITYYVRLLCFYNLSRAKSMGKNVHSVCVREIAFSARKLFAKPIERSRKFVEKCTVH